MFKLEKNVKLYKGQFDDYTFQLLQGYHMDRLSLDMDALLFRIKYMIKNDKDLDKLDDKKKEFINHALRLRKLFGEVLYSFLCNIVGFKNEFSKDDIVDIITQDVKIDNVYINFKLILVSENKPYLDHVDKSIDDSKVFNIFPDKFFRFYVDSYNDGIAKAYPELFENREQHEIGIGNDSDVFCHNVTLQTSEHCSLHCSYCVLPGTKIRMNDRSCKNIEDIEIGDIVLGFNEDEDCFDESFFPTKVTGVMKRKVNTIYHLSFITSSEDVNTGDLYITGEHPVLTCGKLVNGLTYWEWKQVKDLARNDSLTNYIAGSNFTKMLDVKMDILEVDSIVYNIETTAHTYIANDILVHNCYQFNKSPMRMSFDTAKRFIDDLLEDKYGYVNRYNSPALILEFIGGEPLLEIELTRKVYEYFLDKCYELDHPWFKLHRLSICSNGMQYFDKEVQDFFKEYACNISFNISIDGNRELHDSCRVQPNGEGSYLIDMMALNHYNRNYTPERNSKMTLAPQNIKYLFESVKSFIENGMSTINLNCIFEEGWNQETALLEYTELKKLADYILKNDLEHIYISIFSDRQEDVNDKSMDGNYCGGGSAAMLSLRPNGQFYPCIRYMPTSVGPNVQDLCIGHVDAGMVGRDQDSEVIAMLDRNTRRGQTNDICYNCPIGNSCPGCSALGLAVFNNNNKKTTFHCIQRIAECLVNVYYSNLLLIKHPEYNLPVRNNNVPDEWSLLVIDEEELKFLKLLELTAIKIKNNTN